jgi:hypothetical protein
MEATRFKFKWVDDEGNESGILSKKGSFDGTNLTLDGDDIPVEVVLKAQRRFNRLILTVLMEDGESGLMVLAITGGKIRPLMAALNAASSRRWAEMHREHLQKEGRGSEFRTEPCPQCHATIDLSGHDRTAQVYCPFCETLITKSGHAPADEPSYRTCDECGFYSAPRECTVAYFYFLLVVVGWRYRQTFLCHGCMRREGWKMLGANLIFVVGLFWAIPTLIRAYFGGSVRSEAFAGLDRANLLARKGRMEGAATLYDEITQRLGPAAGVHYNHGLGLVNADRVEEAAWKLRQALDDCSNYEPAYGALCACYEGLGRTADLQALQRQWGVEEE